ncbi:hypothetical protein F5Y10DRAFT_269199 [Nemania abortiva]|nr:hypothetical protein F5Y10DRAFT_269199 [Nemania abortiva]
MSRTFEQLVRFTTDAAGLERTFRLLQAVAQILTSYALPINCLLLLLTFVPGSSGSSPDVKATHAVLRALHSRLGLARRYIRLFAFLESFRIAQKLYVSLTPSPSPRTPPDTSNINQPNTAPPRARGTRADIWLDVFGHIFNGMYLLLETATVVDAQEVDGLVVWGPELERAINIEAQRFWLFALVCGVLSGFVKIFKVVAYTPLPPPPRASALGHAAVDAGKSGENGSVDGDRGQGSEKEGREGDDGQGGSGEAWDLVKEQARLRRTVADRKLARTAWKREVQAEISALGRRLVVDALDITIPGSIVGWIPADTGTAGLAMLVTSILTVMEVWEKHGRDIASNI